MPVLQVSDLDIIIQDPHKRPVLKCANLSRGVPSLHRAGRTVWPWHMLEIPHGAFTDGAASICIVAGRPEVRRGYIN